MERFIHKLDLVLAKVMLLLCIRKIENNNL